ncbi:hypothetical protein BGZ73_008266 [Actinomortierella ambigua]|nr:hypothetical protein BGZ73_008266 [Actinomortierella ambigua]
MKFLTTIVLLLAAPIILLVSAQKTGQLYVKLNKATNLRDKDWIGRSDPFIEMWLDEKYKSRSKDTKGQNPVFNQTFCFWVRSGENTLHVRAIDKDTFSNDKIGHAKIPLGPVFQSGHVPAQNYDLPKWFGLRSNGQVNLELRFVPAPTA